MSDYVKGLRILGWTTIVGILGASVCHYVAVEHGFRALGPVNELSASFAAVGLMVSYTIGATILAAFFLFLGRNFIAGDDA